MPTTVLCTYCREAFDSTHDLSRHACEVAPIPVPHHVEVAFSEDPDYMTIHFAWTLPGGIDTLDRPICYGISCLPRHIHRLTRAFLTGNLFDGVGLRYDIHGETYAGGRSKVYGKRINADLTRLGF